MTATTINSPDKDSCAAAIRQQGLIASIRQHRQRGFGLIEIIVVFAILALVAIFGLPALQNVIIDGRVEPTANDLSKLAAKLRGNAAGSGYGSLSTGAASTVANGLVTAMDVVSGTSITHNLTTGGNAGTVAVAGQTSTFTVTLNNVAPTACPGPATILARSADTVTVNSTVAKASGGTYNASTATGACTTGTNTIVIGFQ